MHAYRYVKDILERLCIYFMSTGTSKDDKLLKIPPDLIPEGVISHMFLGECLQTPYCWYALHACVLHTL